MNEPDAPQYQEYVRVMFCLFRWPLHGAKKLETLFGSMLSDLALGSYVVRIVLETHGARQVRVVEIWTTKGVS